MPDALSDEQRRAVFADLVLAQDEGASVVASRQRIAEHHGIALEQVVAIEHEGLKNQWPPL